MFRTLLAGLALSLGTAALAQAPVPKTVLLPQNTPVKIVLAYGVSSKTARAEDRVVMRVFEAVAHNGKIVVPEGATVEGRVSRAVAPGGGGRPGELVIDADYVVTEQGRFRVTGSISTSGRDQTADFATGGMSGAAGASLSIPFGGRKAESANLMAGAGFIARIARDY